MSRRIMILHFSVCISISIILSKCCAMRSKIISRKKRRIRVRPSPLPLKHVGPLLWCGIRRGREMPDPLAEARSLVIEACAPAVEAVRPVAEARPLVIEACAPAVEVVRPVAEARPLVIEKCASAVEVVRPVGGGTPSCYREMRVRHRRASFGANERNRDGRNIPAAARKLFQKVSDKSAWKSLFRGCGIFQKIIGPSKTGRTLSSREQRQFFCKYVVTGFGRILTHKQRSSLF
jgi:hypothetical protein